MLRMSSFYTDAMVILRVSDLGIKGLSEAGRISWKVWQATSGAVEREKGVSSGLLS